MNSPGWRAAALVFAALMVPACGGGGGGGGGGAGGTGGGSTIIVNPPPAGDLPPGVTLVAPSPGATVTAGNPLLIEASVTDADGFVTRVQFFDGPILIGTVEQFPFRIIWTPPAAGTASLTAVATDNAGASTVSGAVQLTVVSPGGGPPPPNQAPTVEITSPTNGSVFTVGTSIDVQIESSDGDGSVVLIDLFEGSNHIGSATQAPVHITWTPSVPGIYSLHAVATDNNGATSSSQPVSVTLQAAGGTTSSSKSGSR